MADMAFRSRDQPDIRARISAQNDSLSDLRELQVADQTQRALRSKQSWNPSDALSSLHRAPLRKVRTLPYPYRPGHLSDIPTSDALPCPLNRSNSLNSLSTIQRETEAAALSLFRGSPISAISPSCAAQSITFNIDEELQDPCPPRPSLRVETLRDQRKVQKLLKRSLKKQEKEQLRAQKEDEQLRRAFLAAEITATRRRDATAYGIPIPNRSKSTRSIASQVVKSLILKAPLSKLSRHVKRSKSNPPTLDDFDSKSAIRDYLNPSPTCSIALSTPLAEVAELPAELPQYTPFEDATRTQDNERVALLEDATPASDQTPVATREAISVPKSMRCDSCKSPIRQSQTYYHCAICDNGDRILCSPCDQAGWSCRHDITERVRSVARSGTTSDITGAGLSRERSRLEAQQYAAALWGLETLQASSDAGHEKEPVGQVAGVSGARRARNDHIEERVRSLEQQESAGQIGRDNDAMGIAVRHREHDVLLREKEISFREKEAAIREQQASLREQEAAFYVKQQMLTLQLQSTLTKQMRELGTGLGAQFPDLSSDDHIRSHATKRKATAGKPGISPSSSTGSKQKLSPKPSLGNHKDSDDGDDDATAGTPKKIKSDADQYSPEKLFACHYCKYDKARYSEQNVQEKQYRGCSSGYWPDISRLKQHLYRVHSLRQHCERCFAKFDSKTQLDAHNSSTMGCDMIECPFPEKFGETQEKEIRRKRPSSPPEEVWYTIYSILFPGSIPPATPYADNLEPASATTPAVVEGQNTMDVLGEVFESRLDQLTSIAGQGWLRSEEARQLIRDQLRASMADVLRRTNPASSSLVGTLSADVSPVDTMAPDSATRSSLSLTPASSIPTSPVHGSGLRLGVQPDSQFLLPAHRHSFSRPFAARTVPKLCVPQPGQKSPAVAAVNFPVHIELDPENDYYDEECNSWSHGDELGMALSTSDLPTDFDFDFATAFDELSQIDAPQAGFKPVKLASLVEPSSQHSIPSDLQPKHSTTSSLDSGYGSLNHKSSTASTFSAPTAASSSSRTRAKIPRSKPQFGSSNSRAGPPREPSPVPASAINFDALDVPFQDFSGENLDLHFDEQMQHFAPCGEDTAPNINQAARHLSEYLDTRYGRDMRATG